ncbi:MAG: nucleotide exchange factor GrpE [bacterium]
MGWKKSKENKMAKNENEIKSDQEIQSEDEPVTENDSDTKVKVEIDKTDQDDSPAVEEIELTTEEKLTNRIAELEDKLLRSAADFDNYKKRIARNYDDMIRSAGDRIFSELLDIIDNFERALNIDEKASFESLQEGTRLIFNQMTGLLEKHNIRPIDALGKPFDPNLHEALMQVPSDEYDEGIVALEISKGYSQDKRVIRHSKVGVSSGRAKEENMANEDNDE